MPILLIIPGLLILGSNIGPLIIGEDNSLRTAIEDNLTTILTYELRHDKTNKDSDQQGHPPSLIRVFACAQLIAQDPSFLHADSEDSDQPGCPGWSESLLGVYSLCWFCHVEAHLITSVKVRMTATATSFHVNPASCSKEINNSILLFFCNQQCYLIVTHFFNVEPEGIHNLPLKIIQIFGAQGCSNSLHSEISQTFPILKSPSHVIPSSNQTVHFGMDPSISELKNIMLNVQTSVQNMEGRFSQLEKSIQKVKRNKYKAGCK